MIQIQRREQFSRAAGMLNKEPQSIRRQEPGLYEVTDKAKGHAYHVRIERRAGQTSGACACEAGTPHKGRRICRAWRWPVGKANERGAPPAEARDEWPVTLAERKRRRT